MHVKIIVTTKLTLILDTYNKSDSSTRSPSTSPSRTSPATRPANSSNRFILRIIPNDNRKCGINCVSLNSSVPFIGLISSSVGTRTRITKLRLLFYSSRLSTTGTLRYTHAFGARNIRNVVGFRLSTATTPRVYRTNPSIPIITVSVRRRPYRSAFVNTSGHFTNRLTNAGLNRCFRRGFSYRISTIMSLRRPTTNRIGRSHTNKSISKFLSIYSIPRRGVCQVSKNKAVSNNHRIFTSRLATLNNTRQVTIISLGSSVLLKTFTTTASRNHRSRVFNITRKTSPDS